MDYTSTKHYLETKILGLVHQCAVEYQDYCNHIGTKMELSKRSKLNDSEVSLRLYKNRLERYLKDPNSEPEYISLTGSLI